MVSIQDFCALCNVLSRVSKASYEEDSASSLYREGWSSGWRCGGVPSLLSVRKGACRHSRSTCEPLGLHQTDARCQRLTTPWSCSSVPWCADADLRLQRSPSFGTLAPRGAGCPRRTKKAALCLLFLCNV